VINYICFLASTGTNKFNGSDAEVEKVIAETGSGRLGIIRPEVHRRYFVLVLQKK
jgi:hypothetical protein